MPSPFLFFVLVSFLLRLNFLTDLKLRLSMEVGVMNLELHNLVLDEMVRPSVLLPVLVHYLMVFAFVLLPKLFIFTSSYRLLLV